MTRERALRLIAFCFWCFLVLIEANEFHVETHGVIVHQPESIRGSFEAAVADFGVPLYGGSLLGKLVYPSGKDGVACSMLEKHLERPENGLYAIVALVDRGDCYFVEKAWNAQRSGADALLVVDNTDEALVTMSTPDGVEEMQRLANNITIPTALVTRTQGESMKAELSKGNQVILELDWKDYLPNPDSRVEWEFWGTSESSCGYPCDTVQKFKENFQEAAVEMEKANFTAFTPHFMFYPCSSPQYDSIQCEAECIARGRYCIPNSPRFYAHQEVAYSGRTTAIENLRQLCIFKFARDAGKPWAWWRYAAFYGKHCTAEENKNTDPDCIKSALFYAQLQYYQGGIQTCMGDYDADESIPLLESELTLMRDEENSQRGQVMLMPTVVVNGKQYRGQLDVEGIMRALCAGFQEGEEPKVCLQNNLQTEDCLFDTNGCWTGPPGSNVNACYDTYRGAICRCPEGYTGDGYTCTDVDECELGTDLCEQHCTNTIGSYECSCDPGMKLVGGLSCMLENACAESNGGCEQMCTSSNGLATCSCQYGLRVSLDGKRCVDIDECKEGTSGCSQACTNSDPRSSGVPFMCSCNEGYEIDPTDPTRKNCLSIEEVMLAASSVGSGNSTGSSDTDVALIVVSATLGTAIVLLLAALLFYRRKVRKHMNEDIRAILLEYLPQDAELSSPTVDGSAERVSASSSSGAVAEMEMQTSPTSTGRSSGGRDRSNPFS